MQWVFPKSENQDKLQSVANLELEHFIDKDEYIETYHNHK